MKIKTLIDKLSESFKDNLEAEIDEIEAKCSTMKDDILHIFIADNKLYII